MCCSTVNVYTGAPTNATDSVVLPVATGTVHAWCLKAKLLDIHNHEWCCFFGHLYASALTAWLQIEIIACSKYQSGTQARKWLLWSCYLISVGCMFQNDNLSAAAGRDGICLSSESNEIVVDRQLVFACRCWKCLLGLSKCLIDLWQFQKLIFFTAISGLVPCHIPGAVIGIYSVGQSSS